MSGVNKPRNGPESAAEPVVDHPDGHALAGLVGEQVDESPADGIAMDDVHLDVDRRLRGCDRLRPRRVVLGRVAQDARGVALDEWRAGRPAEDLVGHHAQADWFARQGNKALPAAVMAYPQVTPGRRATVFQRS